MQDNKVPSILPEGWVKPDEFFYSSHTLGDTLISGIRYDVGNRVQTCIPFNSLSDDLLQHVAEIQIPTHKLWFPMTSELKLTDRDRDNCAPWVPHFREDVTEVVTFLEQGSSEYSGYSVSTNDRNTDDWWAPGSRHACFNSTYRHVVAFRLREGSEGLSQLCDGLEPVRPTRVRGRKLMLDGPEFTRSIPVGGIRRDQRLPGLVPIIEAASSTSQLAAQAMADPDKFMLDEGRTRLDDEIGKLYAALDLFVTLNRLNPQAARIHQIADLQQQRSK